VPRSAWPATSPRQTAIRLNVKLGVDSGFTEARRNAFGNDSESAMDHGLMQDLAHFASEALETASFAVILGAVAISTVLFLMHLGREDFEANYRAYRANLGRGILLGSNS
jgi:hypothetical protein